MGAARPHSPPALIDALVDALADWFQGAARDLPWRKRRMRNGYAALVAESMLQQTQAARVAEYFPRFMRAFPSVRSLAAADAQQVLALWQGLGYYRRATNLHAAARMVVRDFNGRVPPSVDDLLRLPGVGRYTAGAIASIVFGRPAPIVDGNVARVLGRLFADGSSGPAKSRMLQERGQEWTWTTAAMLVRSAKRPGVLNESLMELGATVCLPAPARPRCAVCPVARWCAARTSGSQQEFAPNPSRALPRTVHHHSMVVLQPRRQRILLEQRGVKGMWAGMWQPPTIESDLPLNERRLRTSLPFGVAGLLEKRGEFTHRTTHRTIIFHVFVARTSARGGAWRDLHLLPGLPMSNAHRRVLQVAGLRGRHERAADPATA